MEKRWKLKDGGDPGTIDQLSRELNISPLLATLLVQRGIRSYEEARRFFRPTLSDLHSPFLMKDMDKAIDRIELAISKGEKILVYGDYDVDGTTAVALVYTFLKNYYDKVGFYIPDRYKEGYGISTEGIDFAKAEDYKLIIALDCGIKANEKVDYASGKGIDFIICDHHLPGISLPRAVAVLDPKRSDCSYPYKELSGCGIGFKLVQAFAQRRNIEFEELEPLLDLVVVSIGSDIVPITGENRVLATFGLKQINAAPRAGFKTMLELASVKKELTVNDLVFTIGPRINAAGRIESGKRAVELLISNDPQEAIEIGKKINEQNQERRDLDSNITIQALRMIQENEKLRNRKTTVLFDPSWHKGVVGIVASRMMDTFYRPTIILTESNGMITGSARSVKDFDVYEAIDACSDLLEQFGGHKYAAGLTLKREKLEAFIEKFEEVVSMSITDDMLIPEVEVDAEISLNDVHSRLLNVLKQFQPFGPGNMAPVFLAKKVKDKGYGKIVGNNHLRLDIMDHRPDCFPLSSIGFGLGKKFHVAQRNCTFDACFSIEENHFNGRISLQLNLKDIRSAD